MQHSKWFPCVVLTAVAVAVLVAAGVPVGAFLPVVVLLVCPLMMVVMMRGMGGMHSREDHSGDSLEDDATGRRR